MNTKADDILWGYFVPPKNEDFLKMLTDKYAEFTFLEEEYGSKPNIDRLDAFIEWCKTQS